MKLLTLIYRVKQIDATDGNHGVPGEQWVPNRHVLKCVSAALVQLVAGNEIKTMHECVPVLINTFVLNINVRPSV